MLSSLLFLIFCFLGPGNSTGFLPSSILRPYDPSRDDCLISLDPSPAYASVNRLPSAESSPVLSQRPKSPTLSLRSHSSGESSSSSAARKSPVTPHVLRDTLKRGTLPNKEDGTPYTDADMLEVFAEEDEIFDDSEYGASDSNNANTRYELLLFNVSCLHWFSI